MAVRIDPDNYNIGEEAFHLRDLMQGILERTVAIFQSYGVPLPARQYWTMGQPALDCEQLVIAFVQMYLGAPGDEASEPQRCNVPRSAVVTVNLSRAIPSVGQTGRAPEGQKIQDGSEIVAVDSWIMMESIKLFDQWDEMGYGPGVIATLNMSEAQGGFQTSTLQLTMMVP